jgi:hypothetical protein
LNATETDVQRKRASKVQLAASARDQKFAREHRRRAFQTIAANEQFSVFNVKQFQRAKQLAKRPGREGIEGRHCGNEPHFPLTSNVR